MTLRVPLFPLNAVLFPGMELPLHIFEPRYRQMTALCLREQSPFGVVLIKSGSEVGGPAVPHDVGTLARITAAERLSDGRYLLKVRGTRRFRIESLDRSRPYLSGEVTLLDEGSPQADDEALRRLVERVSLGFTAYVHLQEGIGDQWSRRVAMPAAPAPLSHHVAARMEVENAVRQRLLEAADAEERLRQLDELLQVEVRVLAEKLEAHHRERFRGFGAPN